MAEKNIFPEIINDTFYVKKTRDDMPCEFAYLFLAEKAQDIFLAFFKNRETDKPIVYKWIEEDSSFDVRSRHFILEFIGEAYLSLYIKHDHEDTTDKPLWKRTQAINSGIPTKWWDLVNDIKRK